MDLSIISSLGEEALAPLQKAVADELPEKRGTALLKAQQAVRGFVAAMERGEEPVAPQEPIARLVHDILAKAAPSRSQRVAEDDAALAKSVDAELHDLVKSQTELAFERLEKGYLSALRAMNPVRRAGMRQMMAGARAGKTYGKASLETAVRGARERAYDAVRNPTVPVGPGTGRPIRQSGVIVEQERPGGGSWMRVERVPGAGNLYAARAASDRAGEAARMAGAGRPRAEMMAGANRARGAFNASVNRNARRGAMGVAGIGAAGVAGGAAYDSRRRRKSED